MSEQAYLIRMYESWCRAKQMDPEATATASAYEEWWREDHGVPDHVCTGETLGYCDVCRA